MDVLFDIDGTIADTSWRLPMIKEKPKDWKGFFAESINDAPIKPTLGVLHDLSNSGNVIIFITARPENNREITEAWLDKNIAAPYHKLYMRPNNDHRPDYLVKKDLLDRIRQDGYNPKIVFEDRILVAKMFREQGLICYHVANDELAEQ